MMGLNPWLIVGLIVAALAIGVGGYERGYGEGRSDAEAVAAAARLVSEQKARETEHGWQAKLAALDAEFQKERDDAKAREDQLRADIDVGNRKLRIAVSCSGVSGSTSGAGAGNGDSVELSGEARRAYFDLRASIVRNAEILQSCQGWAGIVSPP